LTACPHPQCGCRYGAPCCLNCPLAECILATPGDPRPHLYRERNQAIASYNQSARRTAAHFAVSPRTVWRIRQRHKLTYHRQHVTAWNRTPTGQATRGAWRRANRGRLAAYMRAYRTRRAILKA
jgi:hypothetical protein